VLAHGRQTIHERGVSSGHMNVLNFGGHQPYLRNGRSWSGQIWHTCRLCQVPA